MKVGGITHEGAPAFFAIKKKKRTMTLYIILIFSAICVGMAISVKAFGTGGKRKRIFQDIYFSIEEVDGIGVLYTKTAEILRPSEDGEPCAEVFRQHPGLL